MNLVAIPIASSGEGEVQKELRSVPGGKRRGKGCSQFHNLMVKMYYFQ